MIASPVARPVANDRGVPPLAPDDRADELLSLVLQSLDDDQAQDIVSIPLAGEKQRRRSYRDRGGPLLASGDCDRPEARRANQGRAGRNSRIEGLPVADWVLIDAGDVIVHIFRPEVRSFYNLERMWGFVDTAVAGEA